MTKVAALWLVLWMVTWPALFGWYQGNPFAQDFKREDCRTDMGISMLTGLLPPTWIIAPFVTGFYEHGFKFSCP